jgi:hypothetical protein
MTETVDTVELLQISQRGGRWWCSRIGATYASTQKGGTFHLGKKTALYEPRRYSTSTVRSFSRHSR